jgi:hypothetical protein
MKKNIAEIIEQQKNVSVDAKSEMYTHGDPDEDYGWIPIPEAWIEDALEEKD